MPIYTFHLRKSDGAPASFAAHELGGDRAATAQAAALLAEHLSASHVEVYDHDRRVLMLTRPAAASPAIRVNAVGLAG